MFMFNKIAIIGTGLIGGSMAAAMKKRHLAKEIVGVSRHQSTITLAKKLKVIDNGSLDLNIIKNADLVVLAIPVDYINKIAKRIKKIIKPECIVIDVGSTKAEIVTTLDKIFSNYIGTHPLAGSEKRGVANISPILFRGSVCILTPTKNTSAQVKAKITKLWKILGAKVVFMSADKHDRVLSFISHLPHIAAFALMNTVPKDFLNYAANGLKDTTRVASSEAEIWQAIFLSNRKNLIEALERFENSLAKIKLAIRKNRPASLVKILKSAKIKREALS